MPNKWDSPEDKARKEAGPPCATCIPDRLKINDDALVIYQICSGQVIMAPMGGAVDINIIAVKTAMDLYQIENQKDCMERILFIFREIKKG